MKKPRIDSTKFAAITIGDELFEHDVIIRLSGKIKKRKKKLSKAIYGTSHTISEDEAKHVYQEGADRIIIGTGQYDTVRLSDEAEKVFCYMITSFHIFAIYHNLMHCLKT